MAQYRKAHLQQRNAQVRAQLGFGLQQGADVGLALRPPRAGDPQELVIAYFRIVTDQQVQQDIDTPGIGMRRALQRPRHRRH